MAQRRVTDKTVLIVDDEPAMRLGLGEQLRAEGHDVEELGDLTELRKRIEGPPPSAVLLDLQLPDGLGLEVIPSLRQQWPQTPVIMMTAHGSISSAVEAMRLGAFTYLQKPLNGDELSAVLRQALETGRLMRQAEDRRQRNSERFSFDGILAKSPAMRKVVEQAKTVARSPATTVLLLGESGTGKGLVARAIHYASARSAAPFLTVTCSAIPEPLLESELLGHEKGAFTDAKARRRGVFEAADGGSVFLDEIGDMPLSLQAKLLGVLEDRCFSRVGSTETIRVDVRIIAATHRDLDRHVAEGRFREDLLYRLRVVPIVIPALRDRTEDVVPLARGFLQRFSAEFGRQVTSISPEAEDLLRAHAWPGNVRELRNVIEHSMLFAKGEVLTADMLVLDPGYHPRGLSEPAAKGGAPADPFVLPPGGLRLDELEEKLVRQALDRAGGNKSRAAKILGISRDQIRYRLEKMGET